MKKYIKKIILKLMILIMLTGATVLFAPVDLIMYKDGSTTTLSSLTYTIIRFRVRFNPHGYIYCTYWGDYPNEVIFGRTSVAELGEIVMKKHTTERIISSGAEVISVVCLAAVVAKIFPPVKKKKVSVDCEDICTVDKLEQ